jgi:hypothetical protein
MDGWRGSVWNLTGARPFPYFTHTKWKKTKVFRPLKGVAKSQRLMLWKERDSYTYPIRLTAVVKL